MQLTAESLQSTKHPAASISAGVFCSLFSCYLNQIKKYKNVFGGCKFYGAFDIFMFERSREQKNCFFSSELNNLFVAQIVALRCTKRLMLYALLMRCPKLCCKFSEIVLGARPARSHAGSLTCTVKFIPQLARANPARLITFRVIFFFFHLIEFVKIERKSGKDSKVKLDLAKHSGSLPRIEKFCHPSNWTGDINEIVCSRCGSSSRESFRDIFNQRIVYCLANINARYLSIKRKFRCQPDCKNNSKDSKTSLDITC